MDITDITRLLQFGDSMLPVGAFSFSNGLESAVQVGLVKDLQTLKEFTLCASRQAAEVDGVALLHAHRSARTENLEGALTADQALYNRKLNEEMRTMAVRMGQKLAEMAKRVFHAPALEAWLADIKAGRTPGTYSVGQGLLFADLNLDEKTAFGVHQYGVASMILSAALRLMRIDHIDTQALLFEVNQTADELFKQVADTPLEAMASYTPTLDILAGIHVKARMRLFMN